MALINIIQKDQHVVLSSYAMVSSVVITGPFPFQSVLAAQHRNYSINAQYSYRAR